MKRDRYRERRQEGEEKDEEERKWRIRKWERGGGERKRDN